MEALAAGDLPADYAALETLDVRATSKAEQCRLLKSFGLNMLGKSGAAHASHLLRVSLSTMTLGVHLNPAIGVVLFSVVFSCVLSPCEPDILCFIYPLHIVLVSLTELQADLRRSKEMQSS